MLTYVIETTEPSQDVVLSFELRNPPVGVPGTLTGLYSLPSITRKFEECTANSSGGRHKWKSWEHYQRFLEPVAQAFYSEAVTKSPGIYRWIGDVPTNGVPVFGNEFGAVDFPVLGLPAMYVKRLDNGFVPEPSDLSNLLAAAHKAILPQVKSELSLLNTLYELKDFKTLPRTLSRISGLNLRATTSRRVQTLRDMLRARVGANARAVADSHLQWQFNILPLLSDIAGIRAAMLRTQRRVNDLVTRQGRVNKRHFVVPLTELSDSDTTFLDHTVTSGPVPVAPHSVGFFRYQSGADLKYKHRRQVMQTSSKFHVEIEYNYNYSDYQTANAQFSGLLDALGVNFNPQIIWNAIPWSFVVDWVLGVSRFLGQFSVGNLNPVINIRRALWSVVRTRRILLTLQGEGSVPLQRPAFYDTPVSLLYEQAYRREVYAITNNSISSSGLNIKEFSLGAALVIARRKRW